MTKVLLLSAGFGDGHRQVANALRESFLQRGVNVVEVDCFENTNRFMARYNQWMYESITRYVPWLYGLSYTLTAKLRPTHFLWKFLSAFSRKAFVQAVGQYEPDIVLQLFPDHASARVQRKNGKPFLGVVITDYSVHSHWFHDNVDAYFIANGQMRRAMGRFVSNHTDIVASGIPIRSQFQNASASESYAKRPYVLFATGGRGVFPDFVRVIQTILHGLPDFNVYVLCGRNAKMLQKIELMSTSEPRLHGVSFVDNVAEWYQHAALAVIKSGGITVSECLASHCPMVFYRPQPGQEADNAKFLETMGTGFVIQDELQLARTLSDRTFQDKLSDMRDACRRVARPNAADQIVEYVLEVVETK